MENQQTDGSCQCHRHTDKGREVVSQSHRNRNTTEESSHGITQIEGALNAAAAQHFATLGMLHDEELLRRSDAEKTDAADEHQHHRYPAERGEEEGEQKCRCCQKLEY